MNDSLTCSIHKKKIEHINKYFESQQRFLCRDCLNSAFVKTYKHYIVSLRDFLFSENRFRDDIYIDLLKNYQNLLSKPPKHLIKDNFKLNQEEFSKTQDRIKHDYQLLRDQINQLVSDSEANMLNLVKKEHEEIRIQLLKLEQDVSSLQLYIHQNQKKDFKVNLNQ